MCLGKQQILALGAWAPATQMGDPDRIPDFWFCPGPALAIWGVKQRLEDISVSVCVSLSLSLCVPFP